MQEKEMRVRRSQLVVPFGVGSIVDMPNQSLMQCSIDFWSKESKGERIHDERLAKRLRKSFFRMPSINPKSPIPFVRFPRWLFCPSCRKMRTATEWEQLWSRSSTRTWEVRCATCTQQFNPRLVPARFICVCERGHVDDFPWVEFVHYGQPCGHPDIEISTIGSTAGLEGIEIQCAGCNLKRRMTGTFDSEFFRSRIYRGGGGGRLCTGISPWQDSFEPSPCECYPRTAQRGGTNVYFSQVITSIVIPPYSDNISSSIEDHPLFHYMETTTVDFSDTYVKQHIAAIAKDCDLPEEEVLRIIQRKLGAPGPVPDDVEIGYRFEEFKVFRGEYDPALCNSRDFELQIRKGEEYRIQGVKSVALVHRLREIRTLIGFSRLEPLERGDSDIFEEDDTLNVHPVSVSRNKEIPWLPAMEVRGEGIFLEFDGPLITELEERFLLRQSSINQSYERLCRSRNRRIRPISARFIFLHTLSHLLIRQLSFECGYSSSALRERIYCNERNDQPAMNGILIYTASGDSEGTLGGLVRQGYSERLKSIFLRALAKSSWCSNDPVCRDSSGQGMHSLNLAACHACALVPETSCEEQNRFLDRQILNEFFRSHFQSGEVIAI